MNKRKERYIEYLQSNAWKSKRKHIAELRNYTCEKCGKVVLVGFHIHHRTYKHLFNERDKELAFLCEDCHKKLHEAKKKRKATIKANNIKKMHEKQANKKRKQERKGKKYNKHEFVCRFCKNNEYIIINHKSNVGVYCSKCRKWYKFVKHSEIGQWK